MNGFLNKYRVQSMITALAMVALGVLLVVFPSVAVRVVCYVFGAAMVLWGLIWLYLYCIGRPGRKMPGILSSVILLALVGLFFLIKADWAVKVVEVLLGISVLLSGALLAYEALLMSSLLGRWGHIPCLVIGLVTGLLGVLMIANPFESALVFARFLGILLIISGLGDVLALLLLRKHQQQESWDSIVTIR